ncbi:UNVERIFIED_CONTAM: hypothetical protein PYX00_002451 [Menopon gallinae]|uniref:Sulfatase N-terminal domain-containing protein n=1 Tax=Menopon gallinae TaxID=328185 RepID=A0AAW2II76_9NEOP
MNSVRSSIILLALYISGSTAVSNGSVRPHIITILIDDLGWNDVGFHGSNQMSTPNIDALAYSGIILNRHYVLPSCTPSRAALLTGAYPIRTGMQGFPMKCGTRRGIPISKKLTPAYFKDLGYHTHLVGKWHLGYHTPDHVPNKRGFDSFFGYYNGYVEYFQYGVQQDFVVNNKNYSYCGYDLHRNDDVDWKWKGKYATSVFTDRVQQIIENHNTSEPLYLLMSHLGVHTGSIVGTGLEVPEGVNVDAEYPHIRDRPRRDLAGVLREVDDSVGAIVKTLQENGMLNNSIILLMSDNGAHTVSTDMQPNWSSNWPLRGTKFTLYEGGVRGAALIWSPLLPKGIVSEQFIHIIDWLPTLYHAAGGDVSNLEDMDGINVWNSLKEMTDVKRDHILLNIDESFGHEGIILKNRWKVTKSGIRTYGHYDLHWGKEENVFQPPNNYYSKVRRSTAGQILKETDTSNQCLNKKKMRSLRKSARVECRFNDDTKDVEVKEGYVKESRVFFCSDYCIYDILNDPCEVSIVDNKAVLNEGVKLLEEYKKTLRPQEDNSVDPLSDPDLRGGAWKPWLSSNCDSSSYCSRDNYPIS